MSEATEEPTSAKRRVLIADDDESVLEILVDAMEMINPDLDLDTAEDGHLALIKLKENTYDLCLTDYMMPVFDGGDLIEAIRETSDHHQKIGIIMISGYASGEEEFLDKYNNVVLLKKPLNMPVLKKWVEKFLALVE